MSITISDVSDAVKLQWEQDQLDLMKRLYLHDSQIVNHITGSRPDDPLGSEYYIAGVDISYIKDDDVNACAALVVVQYSDLKVVYEDYDMVQITAPYIPGFLAFREVEFLENLLKKLNSTRPEFYPHIVMVDGNGLLHVREFGLACHLGVLLDIPTIGVAKNLYQIDGIEKNDEHKQKIANLQNAGDTFPIIGQSKKVYGCALKSCVASTNPIYISVGHKISLESATDLVFRCCKHRIPEPVRLADINSREYLRQHFPSPVT